MRSRLWHLALLSFTLTAALCAYGQKQGSPKDAGSSNRFPKCTEPLDTVPVPNAPHGLFAIMFPDVRRQARTTELLLHNPVVCGANFYLVWNEIDRGPNANPRYDWSAIEDRIKPWIAAGKRVNFITWATGYGGGRAKVTPDYVFSKVESVECPNAGRVPVFWQKDFITNYQAFMGAVVAKYGENPAVGYIRFGLGLGGETFPACMYALKNKGFNPGLWRKYILEMLDFEKSLNSPKPLMVGINTFGQPPDLGFAEAVAQHAIENGIAIGSQGLSIEDIHNDASGAPCAADWCRNFHRAKGKVALELQNRKASNPDRSGPIGSEVDLIPFALKMGTQIFEIYPDDWYIAYDPSDPNYAQYHQEYQRAYEEAAKVVGGN